MAGEIKELGILVGYACNFACAHCVTHKEKQKRLTKKEMKLIVSQANKYEVRSFLFVGGETTLYIQDINAVLSGIDGLDSAKVKITTNGHFAETKKEAEKTLKSFKKLDAVQLSYDKFHAKFLPFVKVENLYAACKKLGIDFSVILTIESPLDMVYAKDLWAMGDVRIGVQKVLEIGAAAKNGHAYVFPGFDRKVLGRRCPNLRRIKYLPGHGFSVCCSSLAYKYPERFVHASIGRHLRGKFYRDISSKKFGELAADRGINVKNLPQQFSHECNLCEHIFCGGKR